MKNSHLNYIVVGLLILSIGCTKKENKKNDPLQTRYDLNLETEVDGIMVEASESNEKTKVSLLDFDSKNTDFKGHEEKVKLLVEKIKSKKPVSFDEVTDLFINKHTLTSALNAQFSHYSKERSVGFLRLKNVIQKLSEVSSERNSFDKKSAYEAELKRINRADIIYNKEASSMADFVGENKMQCYSGTSLNLAVSRQVRSVDDYKNKKEVVIFTSGHVLPGQFITANKESYLIGIETTQNGSGIKMYSNFNDTYGASDSSDTIRIVDADLFVLYEVIKDYISYAPKKLVEELNKMGINLDKKAIYQLSLQNGCGIIDPIALSMFEKTAEKYNLTKSIIPKSKEDSSSLENCAKLIAKELQDEEKMSQKSVRLNHQLNLTAMAFGSADVSEGDIKRSDSISLSNGSEITAESLIQLITPEDISSSDVSGLTPDSDYFSGSYNPELDNDHGMNKYGMMSNVCVSEIDFNSCIEKLEKFDEYCSYWSSAYGYDYQNCLSVCYKHANQCR